MSTNLPSDVVSAGWYADPENDSRLRWWSGASWTTDVIDVPVAETVVASAETRPSVAEPVAEPVTEPEVFLSRRELREKHGPLVTGPEIAAETAPRPWTAPAAAVTAQPEEEPRHPTGQKPDPVPLDVPHTYVPFGDQRSWQGHVASDVTTPVRWNTPGAVALSFAPWIGVIAAAGILALSGFGSQGWWRWVGASLLPLLWSIAAAVRDRKKLAGWGFETLPSLGWLLLGPLAYLIARTVRVYQRVRKGSLALWLFIINSALVSAAVIGVTLTLGLSFASQGVTAIEQATEAGLRAKGYDYSVACPPASNVFTVGSTFECVASDATGTVGTVTVKITGSGGAFIYRLTPSPATGA